MYETNKKSEKVKNSQTISNGDYEFDRNLIRSEKGKTINIKLKMSSDFSMMTNLQKNIQYNDIYNKIFESNRDDIFKKHRNKKRIFKTADGKVHQMKNEDKKLKLDKRVLFELNVIKEKVMFLKNLCDYSYPKIVKNRIESFKNHNKNTTNKLIETPINNFVRSQDVNKTCSFFYSYKNNVNIPKINNNYRKSNTTK